MTRNDLFRIVYSYNGVMEGKEYLEKSVDDEKKIKNLDIAKQIVSSVAKNTGESSNIWVYIGALKTSDSNDKLLDRYYCFIDLETCKEKYISSLEYGEFCRCNSVILLDNYYEIYGVEYILGKGKNEPILGIEGFNILRNIFLSNLSFYLLNPNNDNINVEDFSKHYNDVVNSYKKDGKLTLEISSFTKR